MKPSEVIFSPDIYIPYKKRVRKSIRVAFVFTLLFFVILHWTILTQSAPAYNWTRMGATFLFSFALISLLCWFSQVKQLDSFIIDKDKRTLKIVMRKYDEVFVKGEYSIDKSLLLTILPVKNNWWAKHVNFKLTIKSQKIIVYRDAYSFFLPLNAGNADFYWGLSDAINQIKAA